jgi:hypothetical protein
MGAPGHHDMMFLIPYTLAGFEPRSSTLQAREMATTPGRGFHIFLVEKSIAKKIKFFRNVLTSSGTHFGLVGKILLTGKMSPRL